jgi:hypothetical protein
MRLVFVPLAVVVALAAGCGTTQTRDVEQTPESTTPATAPPAATTTVAGTTPTVAEQRTTLQLYFLAQDGQLVAATRDVEHTLAPGGAALRELTNPSEGATTQVPDGLHLAIDQGKADVTGATLNDAALAQVVYTLTSFPTVQTVNGKTRKDVESFAPAILVENPSPGEAVTSPLRATGTANTFEATFNYSLKDATGNEIAHDFVTATSGTGERGTFDFTAPFTVDIAQDGTLAVFELSAEDGSVIHERRIPLRLEP